MKVNNSASLVQYDIINNLLVEKMGIIKKKFHSQGLIQEAYNDVRERPGLIKFGRSYKNYGHINTFIVEPFSSGEESDSEVKEASVKEVVNSIVDYNTFMIINKAQDFPREAKPALLFANIDEWVNPSYLKQFIEEIPILLKEKIVPDIESIKTFKYKKHYFANVRFKEFYHVQLIFNYFNNVNKKKMLPSKNSKGESIELFLTYDLLELTISNWNAVILRNLPSNCTNHDVKAFCEGKVSNVLYVINPQKIQNSVCSVVVMRDLDDAEKLCNILNKKEQGKDKKIKAHIHPRSCKIRKNTERSHFSKILEKKDLVCFPKIMTNSCSMIFKSSSIAKIYRDLYETNHNTLKKSIDNITKKDNLPNDKKSTESDNKKNHLISSKFDYNNSTAATIEKSGLFSSSLLGLLNPNNTANSENKTAAKQENIMSIDNNPDNTRDIGNENSEAALKTQNTTTTISIDNITNSKSLSDSMIKNTKSNSSSKNNLMSNLGAILEVIQNKSKKDIPNKSGLKIQQDNSTHLNITINTNTSLDIENNTSTRETEIEEKSIELSEKDIEYYTFDFKDQKYYDSIKHSKQSSRDEDILGNKRKSNFSKSFEETRITSNNNENDYGDYNYNHAVNFHKDNDTKNSDYNYRHNNTNYNKRQQYNSNVKISKNHCAQVKDSLYSNIVKEQTTHMRTINDTNLRDLNIQTTIQEVILPPKEELLPPLPSEFPPEPSNDSDKIEPGQIISDEEKAVELIKDKKHSKSKEKKQYTNKKRERSIEKTFDHQLSSRKYSDKTERNPTRDKSSHHKNDRESYKARIKRSRSRSSSSEKSDGGGMFYKKLKEKRKLNTSNDYYPSDRYTNHHSKYHTSQKVHYENRRDREHKYK